MSQKWRMENPVRANATNRAWKNRNPEKVKEYNALWRKKHPEYSTEYHRKHRKVTVSKRVAANRKVAATRKAIGKKRLKRHVNSRDGYLQRTFDINLEEYNRMFAKQEGKCIICGKHQSELKKALSVDHCHKTDKIRGLLCIKCNIAIGMLNDDIENLKCAILYLNNTK